MKEDAARPGRKTSVGKAARREAASLLLSRRPARVEAAARLRVSHAAGTLNRSGRKTHSDRPGEDEAQKALHPQCPAGEAINSSSPDGCPTGEGLTSNSNRRTWTEDEGPGSTPSFRPVLLAESYVKSAAAAVPSWETFQRANHPSGLTRATGIAPPGFYGRKPWLKAKQCRHYYPPKTRCEGSRAVHANIVHKTSRKFTGRRRGTTRRAISTKLRRSACAEAPAFSAPSACRRALSSAS